MQTVGMKPPSRVTSKTRRRADASYRNFRIVAGQRGAIFAGIAYAGKIAMFHAEANSLDDVESALKLQIDVDLAQRRDAAEKNGWSEGDYLLALFLVSPILNPVQFHVIKRIAETAGEPVTLEQLRWPSAFSDDAVQRGLTRLAKMLVHALDGTGAKGPIGAGDGLENLLTGDTEQPWTFRANVSAAAKEFTEPVR